LKSTIFVTPRLLRRRSAWRDEQGRDWLCSKLTDRHFVVPPHVKALKAMLCTVPMEDTAIMSMWRVSSNFAAFHVNGKPYLPRMPLEAELLKFMKRHRQTHAFLALDFNDS
jgi:hypothetical protein